MPLSRLRVRLAAWFALALLTALGALDVTLYWYLRDQASRRLTRDLASVAGEFAAACRREYAEAPGRGLQRAAHEALAEWPYGPQALVVYDASGGRIAEGGAAPLLAAAPQSGGAAATRDLRLSDEASARLVWRRAAGDPPFDVLVVGSTERLAEDDEALAWWLAISSPLVAVLSLVAGYMVSRRALRPVGELERAVAAISPDRLTRVPIAAPPDEIGRLAGQFNALLARLEHARAQNRAFLRRAAHQIRTPLTLVLGESELSLDHARDAADHRAALGRVHRAARQMQHRVNELFLLAQAEAGENITLDETVDADGVLLEAADLMRERAQAFGRRLELERVEPAAVRGREALLQEALLELIENACRHSAPGAPVSLSAFRDDGCVVLEVASAGDPPPDPAAGQRADGRGLGLPIVRWIGEQHGGTLRHTRTGGRNSYALLLPAGA